MLCVSELASERARRSDEVTVLRQSNAPHETPGAMLLQSAPTLRAHVPSRPAAPLVRSSRCTPSPRPCALPAVLSPAAARGTAPARLRVACAAGNGVQEHLRLAFDGTGRLALPAGSLPAEGAVPLSSIVWAWLGCFLSLCLFGLAEVEMAARRAHPGTPPRPAGSARSRRRCGRCRS